MIYALNELPDLDLDTLGPKIADLYKLQRNHIDVVDTLVITPRMFHVFSETGSIGGADADRIVDALSRDGFSDHARVFIGSSTREKYVGLEDNLIAEREYASVKYMIEMIYRSWFDDRARASRLTRSLAHEDSIPAIMIQPCYMEVESLVTRSREGELTSADNYKLHIRNTVAVFHSGHSDLLRRVEAVLCKPSEVYFVGSDGERVRVCGTKEQLITPAAYWRCLGSFLSHETTNAVDRILCIKPEMLSHILAFRLEDNGSEAAYGLNIGLGFAVGNLVFRTTQLDAAPVPALVLAVTEMVPGDLRLLLRCVGAIGTLGGRTSHIALACRQYGIPAVTVHGAAVDESRRILRLPSGSDISEFSPVAVDGTRGEVRFSETARLRPCYEARIDTEHIGKVVRLLSQFDNTERFAQLPMHVQTHIGKLRLQLRRMGYL